MSIGEFGHLLSDVRGKTGNIVYSRNSFSPYIRSHVIPTNPNTASQQAVRSTFSTVSQHWATLTNAQRQTWKVQAREVSRLNIFGDSVVLSGYNWFMRSNINRLVAKLFILNVNLRLVPTPQVLITLNFPWTSSGILAFLFEPAIQFFSTLLVYASSPVSAGVNFVKSEYRLCKVLQFGATLLQPLDVEYIAVFGALPPVGTKVFIKLKMINLIDGRDSVESSLSAIAF